MSETKNFDAIILSHLFSTNLDKFIFSEISQNHIYILNNAIIVHSSNYTQFNEDNLLLRIKNYIESGIVSSKVIDIHKQEIKLIFTNEKFDNEKILHLTELGSLIAKKNW